MQTNYNEVAVLQQGAGKVTGARKLVKKSKHTHESTEMSGKMQRLKRKMEVQKIPLIILHGPSLGIETFLCNDDDGHTKNIFVQFQNLLWMYGMAWMRVRFPGLKFFPVCPCLSVSHVSRIVWQNHIYCPETDL